MRGLIAATMLACAGCPNPTPRTPVFEERFEDEVALRAAWWVDGTFELVATVHPAEHALRPLGLVTLSRPVSLWPEQDGAWLEYTTDCAGPPELWVESSGAGSARVFAWLPTDGRGAFARVRADLPPPGPGERIDTLTLELPAAAAGCVIDNVGLWQPVEAW